MFNIKNGKGFIALTEEELNQIKKQAFEEGKKSVEKKTVSKAKVKTSKGELRNNIVEKE